MNECLTECSQQPALWRTIVWKQCISKVQACLEHVVSVKFTYFLNWWVNIHPIHPLLHGLSAHRCPMSPHFLTRWVSRLLGLVLVSWAFARNAHKYAFIFIHMTLRTKGIDSTNVPPTPHHYTSHLCIRDPKCLYTPTILQFAGHWNVSLLQMLEWIFYRFIQKGSFGDTLEESSGSRCQTSSCSGASVRAANDMHPSAREVPSI